MASAAGIHLDPGPLDARDLHWGTPGPPVTVLGHEDAGPVFLPDDVLFAVAGRDVRVVVQPGVVFVGDAGGSGPGPIHGLFRVEDLRVTGHVIPLVLRENHMKGIVFIHGRTREHGTFRR